MEFWKWLERRYARPDDPLPAKVEAVVAVGIDVSSSGLNTSPQSKAVAEKAVKLFLDTHASKLILTGGYRYRWKHFIYDYDTEADLMNRWVVRQTAVPQKDVILETTSRYTYGNADNVLFILQKNNCQHVAVVAQQWYARRVVATFKKRWADSGIEFAVVKAWSDYGGGSQLRLEIFFFFLLWDTLAFIVSKIKGYY